MNVENTEINGFLIDQFNQHGLDVGKTQGICPLCSHGRQPKNRDAKCSSYDWERGLGTCHNCDTSFQLHTYQRKGNATKEYVKPIPVEIFEPVKDKAVEWFETRGISEQTLKELKVTTGEEFMPQTGKKENTIQFNYVMGDELVNVKYRDGRKNFKLYKGAEKIFYNINSVVGYDWCVITEGEMDALAFAITLLNDPLITSNEWLLQSAIHQLEEDRFYQVGKESVAIAEVQDAPVIVYEDELQGALEEYNEEEEDEKSIH